MPQPRVFDRGTSRQQRGTASEPSSLATEERLRAILTMRVAPGSIARRAALTSFLGDLPSTEKTRLLTQLGNPQDPLAVLLARQVHPSTVRLIVSLLEEGSGRMTAKPAPERMTNAALKAEFLAINEKPKPSPAPPTWEQLHREEREDELFTELSRRGEASSEPDAATQAEWDRDTALHNATQAFDYSSVGLDQIIKRREMPPADFPGGGAIGMVRTLQLINGVLYDASWEALRTDRADIVSATGPPQPEPPYLDPKRMAVAFRYPMEFTMKSGPPRIYVFEIWWFAEYENYYHGIASYAEGVARRLTPEQQAIGKDVTDMQFAILMRPFVGDRMVQATIRRQITEMVAGALLHGAADRLARRVAGGRGGLPGRGGSGDRRADPAKTGTYKQLAGGTPDDVVAALKNPGLFALFERSLSGKENSRGRMAANADLKHLAAAIGEHTTVTPGGRVNVNQSVAQAVWALPANLRGVLVEGSLAQTKYKGYFNVGATDRGWFPDIDFAKTPATKAPQMRVSVKSVDPRAKSYYDKQVVDKLPEHVETLVTGTQNVRARGYNVVTTLDIRMPHGFEAAATDLARTLRWLVPSHLRKYVKVQVGTF